MKKGSGIWNSKFLHKLCRFEKSHYVKDFKWNDDASKAFVPYRPSRSIHSEHSFNLLVHPLGEQEVSPEVWVSLLLLQVTAST